MDELKSLITNLFSLCNNCGECSLTCPPHFFGLFNPMGVLRRLQRDSIEETIQTEPLYNCLTCNRCMTNCPNATLDGGMDFARLIRLLREYARRQNISIPQTEKEQIFNFTKDHFDDYQILQNRQLISEDKSLSIQNEGEIAFFTGDILLFKEIPSLASIDWQDFITSPVKLLNRVGLNPVICDMYGSGHDAYWQGYSDIFKQIAKKNIDIYKKHKVKTIICEEAESYYMWKYVYPQIQEDFPFTILHLNEYLVSQDHHKKLVFDVSFEMSYIFHDISRLGRINPNLFDIPRVILDRIPEIKRKEIDSSYLDAKDYKMGYYRIESPKIDEMWLSHLREIETAQATYFLTTSVRSLIALDTYYVKLSQDLTGSSIPQVKEWSVFLSRLIH